MYESVMVMVAVVVMAMAIVLKAMHTAHCTVVFRMIRNDNFLVSYLPNHRRKCTTEWLL